MTRSLVIALIVLILASVSALTLFGDDSPAPQLGHAPPTHAVGFEPYDNVATHPPGTKRVRAMSAGTAKRWSNEVGSVAGYPCGGELPSCAVLACESGGNPYAENPHSTASGLWQILDGTWAGYAGYARAIDAPVHVQNEKAALLWQGGAGAFHWASCL